MASYSDRIRRFQELLAGQADLAFLPISADLQYLTGVPRDVPNYGLTIHPGDWLEGAWITPASNPVLPLSRMSAELGGLNRLQGTIDLRVLGDWDDPLALVADILKGFKLPAAPRVAISDLAHGETIVAIHRLLPDAKFISATKILRQMRVIKDADEIATMRKAGEITEAAFADVIKNLKHGMTELEVVQEVNFQLRRHGSLGESFTTSLYNSGPNHQLLFGQRLETWKRVLTPPVSILFDFGSIYEGFCYDYGRTVSFGAPDAEFQRVYDLVMASQAAGIAALKAGSATTSQVDAVARKVIEDGGYGPLFRHRLGHAIGMDVHEPPFLTKGDETPLQEGMLFTIEPSITQEHSFSARVEDIIVARPGGGEPLTRGFQSLIVID
jgi:Xaa-Pro dipeptidase